MKQLRSWLTLNDQPAVDNEGRETPQYKYIINQDIAYPLVAEALKIDCDEATAGEMEAMYQLVKMKVQNIASDTPGLPPGAIYIFFEGDPEKKPYWAQKGRKRGEPVSAGMLRQLFNIVRPVLN